MKKTVFAYALAALLAGAGVTHLLKPKPYEQIVPPVLGNPHAWVIASGVVEIATALLVASSRKRSLGAILCAVLFVAVFPANVYAVYKGGYQGVPGPFQGRAVAIARLPLQVVLVWWAWRLADRPRPLKRQ